VVRVVVALEDRWRRPVQAEVLIRDERVEFRYGGGIVGSAARGLMHDWLTSPGAPLFLEGMSLLEVGSGVAIAIDTAMGEPEVPAYVLPDQVLSQLRASV
jgi:hypothetical protein